MSDRPASRVRRAPLADLLDDTSISLGATAVDRDDAVRQVGSLLVAAGAVDDAYVAAMLEREASVSTWVGEGLAFPHATLAGKDSVVRDAIAVATFPDGVDWLGERVVVTIGIAARGRGHIGLVSRLARALLDPAAAAALARATTAAEVRALLGGSTATD